MSLKAGILIIGSLFWDLDKNRPAWRADRLDMARAQNVFVPIRYGRLSKSRGNSYTMVFSRGCPLGHAKMVPCLNTVSSLPDLIREAESLWKAEQPSAKAHCIAADWGCVALLCNPNRPISEEITTGWATHVRGQANYGKVTQTAAEGSLIDVDGRLAIEWPALVETHEPVQFDLLLVTANDPRISVANPDYPDVARIANAWNSAPEYAEYFWNNADNGITTFEDGEIRTVLGQRRTSPL